MNPYARPGLRSFSTPTLALALACATLLPQGIRAQNAPSKPEEPKAATSPAVRDSGLAGPGAEERFKALLTQAVLSGRWAPLKDGELGEEKAGDKYSIVGVMKGSGDNWIVNAKLKYREQEMVVPIPVQVKFAGDAAILVVDKLSIPGGGTYSARVMFYERTYSGTWSGGRGGGMIYGVIAREVAGTASDPNGPAATER